MGSPAMGTGTRQWALSSVAVLSALCRVGCGERGAGGRGGGLGVWASDFDADGRCQAFCFPVKGAREIPALKCSLEERHQHLLGKQMESRRGTAGAARHDGGGGGGRHGGLSRLLQCHGAAALAPYQHMGSLLDLKSHRCENSVSTGKPKARNWSHTDPRMPGPTWENLGTHRASSWSGHRKLTFWARSCVPGAPSSLSLQVTPLWVVAEAGQYLGAAALGAAGTRTAEASVVSWFSPQFIYRCSKLFS